MKIPINIDQVDWELIKKEFHYWKDMSECMQDKRYHAEGDVWTHTKMVATNALNESDCEFERAVLFLASLLHDVAKPITTVAEKSGAITSKNHAIIGSKIVREFFAKTEFDGFEKFENKWKLREQVANIVMLHSLPVHFLDKSDPSWYVAASSMVLSNKMLKSFASCDMNGRICEDIANMIIGIDTIELFEDFCLENKCFGTEKVFITDSTRFRYFFNRKGHPDYAIPERMNGEVIIMSGLQGSGKNYIIDKKYNNLPVVGFDNTREDMNLKYGKNEGQVSQETKERCRIHMRKGQSFVFNATNLIKDIRLKWISLFRDYGYRIVIHYVEKPFEQILKNNKNRSRVVPESAILDKMSHMDIPNLMECHELRLDLGQHA